MQTRVHVLVGRFGSEDPEWRDPAEVLGSGGGCEGPFARHEDVGEPQRGGRHPTRDSRLDTAKRPSRGASEHSLVTRPVREAFGV